MKKLFVLMLIVSFVSCTQKSDLIKNDLVIAGIKGKVKSYTETVTNLNKHETIKTVYSFNDQGYIVKAESFLVMQVDSEGVQEFMMNSIEYPAYAEGKREIQTKPLNGVSVMSSTEQWNDNGQLVVTQINGDYRLKSTKSFNDHNQLILIENEGVVSEVPFTYSEEFTYKEDGSLDKIIKRSGDAKKIIVNRVIDRDKADNALIVEQGEGGGLDTRKLYTYEYF